MATAHLICGLPASGKSTYSSALKASTAGVHFALDHWLITAYGRYAIDTVGNTEHVRRVMACRKLIWAVCEAFLQRDVDVILDDGFFLRTHRMEYAEMARTIGSDVTIHYVNTPAEIIEKRIEKRNRNLPRDNFTISQSMLEQVSQLFDEPSADERIRICEIKYNPK